MDCSGFKQRQEVLQINEDALECERENSLSPSGNGAANWDVHLLR